MHQNKPKKLYWLHSHFLYWMGGTKYIFEVLKRLHHDYDLTVIVENSDPYASQLYKQEGIKLVSFGKLSSNSLFYWLTFPVQLLITYVHSRKLVKDGIVVTSMFPMNIIGSLLAKHPLQLCFEPFAFFHDPDFQQGFSLPKRLLLKLLKLLYGKVDVWATRRAKHLITLNQVTAKGINNIYHKSSVPVYTGIDSQHFRPFVSRRIRKQYQGKDILVHSTDYTPVKGTDRMIRIFAKVKKLHPSAHLLITSTIQNPSQEKIYRDLAKALQVEPSVEFLGFVDYNLLPELYSLAKALVQCSYSELSGTTSMALPVKEALSCGTACIRSPVTTEDVEDGITGYLVDPRQESLMVKRIIALLTLTDKERRTLSLKARQKIIKLYTWDQTAARISRIINSV